MTSGCSILCSLSSPGSFYTDGDPQSCYSLGLSSLVTVMFNCSLCCHKMQTLLAVVWSVECGGPAAQLTDNRTARLSAAGVTTAPAPAAMRGVGHHPPLPLPAADTGVLDSWIHWIGPTSNRYFAFLLHHTTASPASTHLNSKHWRWWRVRLLSLHRDDTLDIGQP